MIEPMLQRIDAGVRDIGIQLKVFPWIKVFGDESYKLFILRCNFIETVARHAGSLVDTPDSAKGDNRSRFAQGDPSRASPVHTKCATGPKTESLFEAGGDQIAALLQMMRWADRAAVYR
jgi:hypothetical protein